MDQKRRTLVLGLGAAPFTLGTPLPAFAADAPPSPDSPGGQIYDMRDWAAQVTAGTAIDSVARATFRQKKVQTALSHKASGRSAQSAALQVAQRTGTDLSGLPVPGGVGYGVFFHDRYKTGWGTGTSIMFDLLCPEQPGGNVDTFLYLTSTNRSALGVEAFVLYHGQTLSRFMVFDWALANTNPWVIDIPLALLEAYLFPRANTASAQRTLSIMNSTYQLGEGVYRNEVLLFNHLQRAWDRFYLYDYAAQEWEQKSGWIGSWGPIIETFQNGYAGTNPMGARRTLLAEAGRDGKWTPWSLLRPANSYVRHDPEPAMKLRYVAPNFAFVATS